MTDVEPAPLALAFFVVVLVTIAVLTALAAPALAGWVLGGLSAVAILVVVGGVVFRPRVPDADHALDREGL